MTEPYYDQDGITIYHGDCLEVLVSGIGTAEADVTITDPPYNVGKEYDQYDDAMPGPSYRSWLSEVIAELPTDGLVFTPGMVNLFHVPELLDDTGFKVQRTLAWHKREFAGDLFGGGPAMCWEAVIWASRVHPPFFNRLFGHAGRDFLIVPSTHGNTIEHPCVKPIAVMRWLIGLFAPEGDGAVLDPFMGSGTTLVAAKSMGRCGIGIEISERYCEIAAKRLAQGVLVA